MEVDTAAACPYHQVRRKPDAAEDTQRLGARIAILANGDRRLRVLTDKERMAELIQEQPDDSTYEEILRELTFARMIDRGLDDSRAGRAVSHEEMGRRIRTWQR
jgi:predicted transcriptional regulator